MNSGVTVQHDSDFNTDVKEKEKAECGGPAPQALSTLQPFYPASQALQFAFGIFAGAVAQGSRDGSGTLVRFTLPVLLAVK